MIGQSNKYEKDIKELHSDYEKQILELRAKIGELTAKVRNHSLRFLSLMGQGRLGSRLFRVEVV